MPELDFQRETSALGPMSQPGAELIQARRGAYQFYLQQKLGDEQLDSIVEGLNHPLERDQDRLVGRGVISMVDIPQLGQVVIKHYQRGGLMRFLCARRYLRLGKLRPQVEFELLHLVRSIGVAAPEPIAIVTAGGMFYRGWLVTKRIEHEYSLAQLSVRDEARVHRIFKSLARQITLLIEHKICHIDLHPGNVLVDAQDGVFLLDFDKAHQFKGTRKALRDYYLCRWRRAVIKHRLPEVLSELLSGELRRSFSEI